MQEGNAKLRRSWLESLSRHFTGVVAVYLILLYMVTYLSQALGLPIRGDGGGYYAYLPALVIHGDPSYETDARVRYGGEMPRWTYVLRYPPTGRYLNALHIGVSLLMLPFFLVAHFLTYWFGWPWTDAMALQFQFAPDGYSFFYQHAAGLSGLAYFLAGFALLKRYLERLFSPGIVMAALAVLLLGTNLSYYAAAETVCSHPYTFFLAAAMIGLTRRWYEEPESRRVAAGLGAVMALLLLVRPLNALLCLWVPLYGVASRRQAIERLRFFAARYRSLLWMAAVAAALFLPQLMLWKYATGHYLVKTYQWLEARSFGIPRMDEFLFGLQRGVFVWFPAYAAVVAGVFCLRGPLKSHRLAVLTTLAAYPLVTASWSGWQGADGFGARYVVDVAVPAAFTLAAFLAAPKARWLQRAVAAALVLAVGYTLFLLTLVYRHEFGLGALEGIKSPDRLYDAFWWRAKVLLNRLRAGGVP